MAENTVHTRIQLKNDTEENWMKSALIADGGTKASGSTFIPLKGEIIIYSTDNSHPFSRIKVGNGIDSVPNLPFVQSNNSSSSIEVYSTANWQSMPDYIPKSGTLCVFTDKETIEVDGEKVSIPGIKVSDGKAYVIDLPFVGDDVARALLSHVSDEVRHITAEEREFWNNKINVDDYVLDQTLILTRN